MTAENNLSTEQEFEFNRFLLDGTTKALVALQNIFDLNVTSSDSTISVAPASANDNLKHFGNGPLIIVTSKLANDIQGNCSLLLRWRDFRYLSEVMWPILSLMFLSKPDLDLDTIEGHKPEWMLEGQAGHLNHPGYQEQMMDALKEMGNVLIGLYSKSIFNVCGLSVNHSMPLVMKDPQQTIFQRMMFSENVRERIHLVIENDLFFDNGTMKMWFVVSPTPASFNIMLQKLDEPDEGSDQDQWEETNWA